MLTAFEWSETKRAANPKAHGLDFVDASCVFEGITYTYEDDRFWKANMKSASSRSAKPPGVKRKPTSTKSRTDWVRLKSREPPVPTADHPEADIRHIVRGVVRRGLQPVPPKTSIALRVDRDVLEWFKAQGPGYQTRINSVLRAFRDASK
jgi:uncharacterized protein (DUF4415 family)